MTETHEQQLDVTHPLVGALAIPLRFKYLKDVGPCVLIVAVQHDRTPAGRYNNIIKKVDALLSNGVIGHFNLSVHEIDHLLGNYVSEDRMTLCEWERV